MSRSCARGGMGVGAILAVVSAAWLLSGAPLAAQNPSAAEDATKDNAAEKAVEKEAQADAQETQKRDPRGRLPNHWARHVTDAQREKIYEVQEKYDEKLRALMLEIRALRKQMRTEMESVLSEQQVAAIRKAEQEAKAAGRKSNKREAPGSE